MKLLGALVPAVFLACTTGPWDLEALEAHNPALANIGGHRLSDTTPYVLAHEGELAFFLCRWEAEKPIPVSLPPDATEEETRLLQQALRAWEGAGLGVRFGPEGAPDEGIEIRFIPEREGRVGQVQAANTVADCRVDPSAAGVLPAKLAFASIHMHRGDRDYAGRPVPYNEEELLGSALHELGHALGFSGHARHGSSIMVRETDAVRRAGRRVLKGEAFEDATLRALYAVPSGTVVGRGTVSEVRTEPADRMFALAQERGWRGPYTRSGDTEARMAWRDEEGVVYPLLVPDPRLVLRDPKKFVILPARAARDILE